MIDDRSHTGMMALRHGNNFGSRSGDSMPDYDNVKVSFFFIIFLSDFKTKNKNIR